MVTKLKEILTGRLMITRAHLILKTVAIIALLFATPAWATGPAGKGIYCHDEKYPQGYFFEPTSVYLYDDINPEAPTHRLPYHATNETILWQHQFVEWKFILDRKSLQLSYGSFANPIYIQCRLATLTEIKAELRAVARRKQSGNKL